jgi:hypothetical protein
MYPDVYILNIFSIIESASPEPTSVQKLLKDEFENVADASVSKKDARFPTSQQHHFYDL